jgi:hypothetical protein
MKFYSLLFLIAFILSCKTKKNDQSIAPYDDDVLQSIIAETDSLKTFDFVNTKVEEIKLALNKPLPVLLCGDSLNDVQKLAQEVALADLNFTANIKDKQTGKPYRTEIFAVLPARESDFANTKGVANLANSFRVEMYNYPLNLTTVALVDIAAKKVLNIFTQEQTQPEIPAYLKNMAIKIAINSPELQKAYGIKPNEADALMANTKTALNRTRCERSRHLCVAPTFIKGDKALWAIVDLTDFKLVGVRWTNTGTTGTVSPITERRLQDDKLTACFCEKETTLDKYGWKMNYMLTSSDGLRVSQVNFNGKNILQNAKLVDWHVSYSGTDGFGYSDAVGCPYFSQAAVIAFEPPKNLEIKNDAGEIIGFALEQVFKSELWPSPCNYNYRQRFEFYKDGKFRVAAASIGRGCGNDGTYRPVFRIAFAAQQQNFYEFNGSSWDNWEKEKWQLQSAVTKYSPEKFQYKIANNLENGFFIQPGTGNFGDGGRGDNAFLYVTENKPAVDEGEADLVTIGPCCNTDFQQGPEKYIGASPDVIKNKKLVVWYVPQLKNDNAKGSEYCWAESVLENGKYVTKSYPCFAGPMFVPIKTN